MLDNDFLNENINVDLHIHSFASDYKEAKGVVKDSIFENIDVLLRRLKEKRINLFAFSDHNRFDANLFWKTHELLKTTPEYKSLSILASSENDIRPDQPKGEKACENPLEEAGKSEKKIKGKYHLLTVFKVTTEEEAKRLQDAFDNSEANIRQADGYFTESQFAKLLRDAKLDVILIGEQRSNLDRPSNGSISDAFIHPTKVLELGFFSALECQSPKVQGILLSAINKAELSVPIIIGSDCHQWSAYPNHDADPKNAKSPKDPYFFTIKSQPTFEGLLLALTSPSSRFNRMTSENPECIRNIVINGKKIPLSPGFNAIIGENGSGKSTILNAINVGSLASLPGWQKKLVIGNGFSVNKTVQPGHIKYVSQGSLVTNKFTKDDMFADEKGAFNDLDTSRFEKSVTEHANQIWKNIQARIEFNEAEIALEKSDFLSDGEKAFFTSHYVKTKSDLEEIAKPSEARLKAINRLMEDLGDEISNPYYLKKQLIYSKLTEAFALLKEIRSELIDSYLFEDANQKIQSIISKEAEEYVNRTAKLSSSQEREAKSHNEQSEAFKKKVVRAIKDKVEVEREAQPRPIDISNGITKNTASGYCFFKTSAFYGNDHIDDDFLCSVFNKDYAKNNSYLVDSFSALRSAIKGCGENEQNLKSCYDARVNSFIETKKAVGRSIVIQDNNEKVGQTLGEESLAYYKYITREKSDYSVLLIDQPEDNISNRRVLKELIGFFNQHRDKRQIIMVTHNPLLVVNLDVDNVISLTKKGDVITSQNGCLESGSILDEVAKVMDGGREAIKNRLKIYGEKD